MNRIQRIRRLTITVTSLACTWLGLTAVAPAAFAQSGMLPHGPAGGPPDAPVSTVTRTIVLGGTPGWQIALIAAGAALLAVALTVLAGRVRAAHRKLALSAA